MPAMASRQPAQQADVLVVGTGVAGAFTALKLAQQPGLGRVCLLSKQLLGSSHYAQGGIAAVLPAHLRDEDGDDTLEAHIQDTLRAGTGRCVEAAVRAILAEGGEAIADLLAMGVPFDRSPTGKLALTREAAHGARRIVHAGGDATGRLVQETLTRRLHSHPKLYVYEDCQVTALEALPSSQGGRLTAWHRGTGHQLCFEAPSVVLATGGIGQLYTRTTNPPIATGDGHALALTLGVPLQEMAYVQFHPTTLVDPVTGSVEFLVSEAVRGEGGRLRNAAGEAFAGRYHPDAELAPRDVVTRAIDAEIRQQAATGGPGHVFLDMTGLDESVLEGRFPTIVAGARALGLDPRHDMLPVAPAAHYLMGGIETDYHTGQTCLPWLYAVGECAWTGLHGANRLASNSLLECVVMARRVAEAIGSKAPDEASASLPVSTLPQTSVGAFPFRKLRTASQAQLASWQAQLRAAVSEGLGIQRTEAGIRHLLSELNTLAAALQASSLADSAKGLTLANMLLVARAMAEQALVAPAVGAHYRVDLAKTAALQGQAA